MKKAKKRAKLLLTTEKVRELQKELADVSGGSPTTDGTSGGHSAGSGSVRSTC